MSTADAALAGLVLAVATGAGGYLWGHHQGKAAQIARDDAQTVGQLTGLITSHGQLVSAANQASASLRTAQAARAAADKSFSKEFRDALRDSAPARAGCRFDDGLVRQLDAARARAGDAAARGTAAGMPAASAAGER